MEPVSVAIVNLSRKLHDHARLAKGLNAVQLQVSDHFAPHWNTDARLTLVHGKLDACGGAAIKRQDVADHWLVVLKDKPDDPRQAGRHGLTREGRPAAEIFVEAGGWTRTLSHELLEMLANPFLDRAVLRRESNAFYVQEVCDPVERGGYEIGGVEVANFVLPAWFSPDAGRRYDQAGRLPAAFNLAPHGSIGVFDGSLAVMVNKQGGNLDAARADKVTRRDSKLRTHSDEIWSDEIWSDEIWSDEIWSDEIWS